MHKCQKCGAEATVHDFKLMKGGIASQIHLCESCANKMGVESKGFKTLEELLEAAAALAGPSSSAGATGVGAGAEASGQKGLACRGCGMGWSEFREKGQLGCASCYEAFETQIAQLAERMHEGGAQHMGKRPRGASAGGGDGGMELRAKKLRQQLTEALALEQYERAAEIRDRLNAMGAAVIKKESTAGEAGGRS